MIRISRSSRIGYWECLFWPARRSGVDDRIGRYHVHASKLESGNLLWG